MVLRARVSQHGACTMTRNFTTSVLVVMLFCGLFLSHRFLHPRLKSWVRLTRGGFRFPSSSNQISNDTMLAYSQFNPDVASQRDRINFLLQVTDFGKIGMREVMRRWKSPLINPRPAFRKLPNTWMLPLTTGSADKYMPRFFELSTSWLGEHDDSVPQVMHDFLQTVEMALQGQNETSSWSTTQDDKPGRVQGENSHQSCAVVGNSGILLDSDYGNQIDNHNIVIRVNNAEVSPRYKRHVGSKTSLSFVNSNVLHRWSLRSRCHGHSYAVGVPIVLYICQPSHFLEVAKCMHIGKEKALDKSLFVTPSLFDAACATITKWYSVNNFLQTTGRPVWEWDAVHDELEFHYSSGMQAVVLALGLCDSVDMFGFGKAPNSTHHYHTSRKEELSLHDYAAEYLFYDDLVHRRSVPLLTDAGIPIPPVRLFF